MPNRIIRDCCKTSQSLSNLSAEAERLFWRLITVADDFGRFEASPVLLLAKCFPLKVQEYKLKDISKWYVELESCEHVQTYASGCYHYGFFTSWDKHQTTRAKASRYPSPTSANICSQMQTDALGVVVGNEVVIGNDLMFEPSVSNGHASVVFKVWGYYLAKLDKNPKMLAFTRIRRQKGAARLECALRKTGGDLDKGEALMKLAVDALAASQHHREGNYTSWEKNLFPSDEKFEWWLERVR